MAKREDDVNLLLDTNILLEMEAVTEAALTFGLDFDDAYQYATAKGLDVRVVSFDSDFDRTD